MPKGFGHKKHHRVVLAVHTKSIWDIGLGVSSRIQGVGNLCKIAMWGIKKSYVLRWLITSRMKSIGASMGSKRRTCFLLGGYFPIF